MVDIINIRIARAVIIQREFNSILYEIHDICIDRHTDGRSLRNLNVNLIRTHIVFFHDLFYPV